MDPTEEAYTFCTNVRDPGQAIHMFRGLRRGEKLTYYKGWLNRQRRADENIDAVARIAKSLQDQGVIALHCKRLGPKLGIEYVAVGK